MKKKTQRSQFVNETHPTKPCNGTCTLLNEGLIEKIKVPRHVCPDSVKCSQQ